MEIFSVDQAVYIAIAFFLTAEVQSSTYCITEIVFSFYLQTTVMNK